MTPLERELQGLASAVDWPDPPDVSSAVLASIADERPWRAPRRRRLALALAVVLAALLAVLAVPPARTAIFDWLGIGSARIIRVDELPSLAPTPGLQILGQRVTLEGARLRAGFPFAGPPDDERPPDEIRVAPGMRVTYVWHDGARVRLLVTQFPGDATDPGLIKKFVSSGTRIELAQVDGNRAWHLLRPWRARTTATAGSRCQPVPRERPASSRTPG